MTSFLTHWGYLAVIALAFIQACCIPISSEITFGFAGVLAFQGHLSLPLVIVLGTLGELAGSSLAYGLGRLGGRHTVERYRRYLLMTRRDVQRVERFFDGRGTWSVALARIIPLVRAFVGLVAGFMEVPALPFELFNLIGTAAWASALTVIGYELGSDWDKASRNFSHATDILSAVVVLMLIGLIVHKGLQVWHEHKADGAAAAAGNPAAGRPAAGQNGQASDHPLGDGQLRDGQLRDGQPPDGQLRDGQLGNGRLRNAAGSETGAQNGAPRGARHRAPSHRRNG